MSEALKENLAILGLKISDADLRGKLKSLRIENHPDTSGGRFRSDEQRVIYHASDDALRMLDETAPDETGTNLQIISDNQKSIWKTQAALVKLIDEQRQKATTVSIQDAVKASESKARFEIASSTHYR